MEETRRTLALILNRQDYREHDSLVTVYTPHAGRLSLLARGTKKPSAKLAGHIEPLTLADIMIIRGRGFDYLGSAVTRNSYPLIRHDLNKLYYAGQAISLYLRQTEENPGDERLFDLLAEWLGLIENFFSGSELAKERGSLFLAALRLKFLSETGHRPEMSRCLVCRQRAEPGENYFDLLNGGLTCGSCRRERLSGQESGKNLLTISDNCVKMVRFILNSDLATVFRLKADKKLLKELVELTTDFLNFVKSR